MIVFLESDIFGYEEFQAEDIEDIDEALKMIRDIYYEAIKLKDGVGRKIGIRIKGR